MTPEDDELYDYLVKLSPEELQEYYDARDAACEALNIDEDFLDFLNE